LRKKSAFLIQTTDSGRYFREHHAYSQMIAATHLLQCNGRLQRSSKVDFAPARDGHQEAVSQRAKKKAQPKGCA
jgi:hypothetical protein